MSAGESRARRSRERRRSIWRKVLRLRSWRPPTSWLCCFYERDMARYDIVVGIKVRELESEQFECSSISQVGAANSPYRADSTDPKSSSAKKWGCSALFSTGPVLQCPYRPESSCDGYRKWLPTRSSRHGPPRRCSRIRCGGRVGEECVRLCLLV